MSKLNKNKKGQLIAGLVAGIAGLIILVIVSFLIVDTLNGANLLSTTTASVSNETLTSVEEIGELLTYSTLSGVTCAVSQCVNSSDGRVVPTANYTATGCRVKYSGATQGAGFNNSDWKCTYAYTWDGKSKVSVNQMIGNYTKGIDNVSEKIPTVLLVAAVVLLFGAIVILVNRSRLTTGATGGDL